LSNGFSGLAKGLLRSANDVSTLAKDVLSLAPDILRLAKDTFGSARDIFQISKGFSRLSNGFWGLSKGKTGFPSQKTRFLMIFACPSKVEIESRKGSNHNFSPYECKSYGLTPFKPQNSSCKTQFCNRFPEVADSSSLPHIQTLR